MWSLKWPALQERLCWNVPVLCQLRSSSLSHSSLHPPTTPGQASGFSLNVTSSGGPSQPLTSPGSPSPAVCSLKHNISLNLLRSGLACCLTDPLTGNYGMFCGFPDLYTLMPTPSSRDDWKCVQTLPHVPWEWTKITPNEEQRSYSTASVTFTVTFQVYSTVLEQVFGTLVIAVLVASNTCKVFCICPI